MLSGNGAQAYSPVGDLPMGVDLQDRLVELGYLPVDEGLQCLLQAVVVPLQFPLVLLLIRTNQALVLTQCVLAPVQCYNVTIIIIVMCVGW